jgi:hypothetical protein
MKLNKPTNQEMNFLKSFYPEDFKNLTQKHIEVLYLLKSQEDLETPVFVELDGQTLCIE